MFNPERIRQMDAVLGPARRRALLANFGAQAVEARLALHRNFDAGDTVQLLRDVHRLKGAAQIVGADDLIHVLLAMERCSPTAIDEQMLGAADEQIAAVAAAIAQGDG